MAMIPTKLLILKWVLVIGSELTGMVLIILGCKRERRYKCPFHIKHLFLYTPVARQSGKQFIIEGVICIIAGIMAYFVGCCH
jgi:hypothetical protein